MDPTYLQFITSLMNDDGFDLPTGRRPSLGAYPGIGQDNLGNLDDYISDNSDLARERAFSLSQQPDLIRDRAYSISQNPDMLLRDRAFSLSRERGFSWDAGFEDLDNSDLKDSGYTIQDIMQTIGRKRTMSGDVNFNFIPMPADSYQPYPATLGSTLSGGNGLSSEPLSSSMLGGELPNSSNHHMTPTNGNIEPNFMNMMPNSYPNVMRANHMTMQHSMCMGMGMDQHQMHGMSMQLLRPLMPSMGMSMAGMDEGNIRVGAYTKEERQIRIAKFRAKKNRRVWKKQIKYDCRKKLADNRPRIKGRFVTRKDDGDEDADADCEGEGGGEEETALKSDRASEFPVVKNEEEIAPP